MDDLRVNTLLNQLELRTKQNIETADNYLRFRVSSELFNIFDAVEVTDTTTAKELLEKLHVALNKHSSEAMHEWEANDPDN